MLSPEDYVSTVKDTLGRLPGELGQKAKPILDNGWVQPDKRIFNNAQVSDHFAIIPTGESSDKLSPEESKIYDFVCRRFLGIFYPPAEFDETLRTSIVGEHKFISKGLVLVSAGYLDVLGKAQLDRELPALTDPDKGSDGGYVATPTPETWEVHAEETKPPARYTEATLLSAMEGPGNSSKTKTWPKR